MDCPLWRRGIKKFCLLENRWMDRCSRIFSFFFRVKGMNEFGKLGTIFFANAFNEIFEKLWNTLYVTRYAEEEDIVSRNSSRPRRKTGRKSACRVNLHARFLNNVLRTSIPLVFSLSQRILYFISLFPFQKGGRNILLTCARERELFCSFFSGQLEEKEEEKKKNVLEDVQTRYRNTLVATIGTRQWKYIVEYLDGWMEGSRNYQRRITGIRRLLLTRQRLQG